MNMRHAAGHLGVPVFLLHLILDLTLSPGTGSTEGLAKDCVIQLLLVSEPSQAGCHPELSSQRLNP